MPRKSISQTGKAPARKKTASKAKTSAPKVKKTVKKKSSADVKLNDIQRNIENKAYELFQRRGCSHGLDNFDWSLAETIVRMENDYKKAKKASLSKTKNIPEDLIRKKAYELFEQKGCRNGANDFDWFVAEQIVKLETD